MKVKIDVDTRTFVRFGLVVIGFVAAIVMAYKARTPLTILGISLFLALALNPPVSKISKHLPGRSRVGATAIAYLAVLTFIGGMLFLVVPPVVEQTAKFAQTVPDLIDQISQQRHFVDDFVSQYNLKDQVDQATANAKNQAAAVASNLGNSLVGMVGAVFSGAATILIIIVLTFLMLIEGPYWMKLIWDLYQDPDRLVRHRHIVNRMYRVVTGYVNGQLLVASVAAVMTLLTILVLSVIFPLAANLAVPLAVIIFLTGLIPMVGATLGAILVSLVLLLNSVAAAVVFVIYFIIYQQIENNFIAPTIQSKTVELSALLVLSAILIGVSIFGLIGGIISIPIAGCIRVLVIEYMRHSRQQRHEKEHSPIAALAKKLSKD